MATSSVNKTLLIGNLGADPETRYTAGGTAVTNINLATSDTWRDKNSGERQERTEWHRVVFFARLAEIAGEYLRKGSKVYVEGRLQTRKWQTKDGQDAYTTEIVANDMQMLGSREGNTERAPFGGARNQSQNRPAASNSQPSGGGAPAPMQPSGDPGFDDDLDNDIPFVSSNSIY